MTQTANTVNFTFTGTDLVSRTMSAVAGNTNKLGTQMRKAEADIEAFNRKSKALNTTLTGLVSTSGFMSTIMAGFSVTNFVTANAEFENMSAKLNVLVKDYASAGQYFKEIQTFAKETPYTIEQTTMAYIKLVSRGLKPSVETLRSMGDIASVLGTRLEGARGGIMQVVEAVADLVVGQTRRFEELGVSVAQTKNEVTFYFDGVYTKVKKDTNDLVDFVTTVIGGKFAGAMESQMQTIGGKWSNLSDSIQIAFYNIGKSGFNAELKRTIDLFTQAVNSMSEGSKELSVLISLPLKVLNAGLEIAINNVGFLSVALSGLIAKNVVGVLSSKFTVALAAISTQYEALKKVMAAPLVIPISTGSSVVAGRTAATAASKTAAGGLVASAGIDAYTMKMTQAYSKESVKLRDAVSKTASAQTALNNAMKGGQTGFSLRYLEKAVKDAKLYEASLVAAAAANTGFFTGLSRLGAAVFTLGTKANIAGLAVSALTAAYLTYRAYYKTDEEKADAKINQAIKDAEKFNSLAEYYKKISARKIIDQTDPTQGTKGIVNQYAEDMYQKNIDSLVLWTGLSRDAFEVEKGQGAKRIEIVEKLISKQLELQKIIRGAQKEKEALTVSAMQNKADYLLAQMKQGGEYILSGYTAAFAKYSKEDMDERIIKWQNLTDEIKKYNDALNAGITQEQLGVIDEAYNKLTASYFKGGSSDVDIVNTEKKLEVLRKTNGTIAQISEAEALLSVIREKSTEPLTVMSRELEKQEDSYKVLPERTRMMNEFLEKGRVLLINDRQAAGDTADEFAKIATSLGDTNSEMYKMYKLVVDTVDKLETMRINKVFNSSVDDMTTKISELNAELLELQGGGLSDYEKAVAQAKSFMEKSDINPASAKYTEKLQAQIGLNLAALELEREVKNQREANNKAEAAAIKLTNERKSATEKAQKALETYNDKVKDYYRALSDRKNQAMKVLGGDVAKESSLVDFNNALTDLAKDAKKNSTDIQKEVNAAIGDTSYTESLERQAEAFKKFQEDSSGMSSWMDQLSESIGDSSSITKQFTKRMGEMNESVNKLLDDGNFETASFMIDEMAYAQERFAKVKLDSYNAGIEDLIEDIKLEGEYTGKTRLEIAQLDAVKKAKLIGDKYNLEVSQATIDKLKEEIAETERLKKSYDTYQAGMRVGLQTVIDDSTEKTQSMAKLITGAFAKAEDALVNFVKNGKLQLKDMFSFIAEELLRMQLKQNIIAPISTMLQGLLPAASGALSGSLSSSSSGYTGGTEADYRNKANRAASFGSLIPAAKYNNNTSAAIPYNQTVVIDARGADKGVEERIKAAMERNKQETIAKIQELNNRGGSFARNSGRYRD